MPVTKKPVRLPTQGRKSHPGKKGMRGQPLVYDELKKACTFTLTPTAKTWWANLAQAEGCSISEAMERDARGSLISRSWVLGESRGIPHQSR
jgi:hypothetical protein